MSPERSSHLDAVILLSETLDLRDISTSAHSQTVARYAATIAEELGLDAERKERVRLAGMVHDLGKIGVPDHVLLKPGSLTAGEWQQMQRHPEIGAQILDSASLHDLASWVLAHHERPDGTGYPLRLSGDAVSLEARILAVADAYEAMTSDRPYRAAMPAQAAREELLRHRGTQLTGPLSMRCCVRSSWPTISRSSRRRRSRRLVRRETELPIAARDTTKSTQGFGAR